MDAPPPILAYQSPGTAIRIDDGKIVLPQPPAGWEMLLISIAIFFCIIAAFLSLGSCIKVAFYDRGRQTGLIVAIPFLIGTVAMAVYFTHRLVRRRRFEKVPCTLWIDGDALVIHFPTQWGDRPKRYVRARLGPVRIRRRGWAANLLPLFQVDFRGSSQRWAPLSIPFVTSDVNDAAILQERITEMLR